MRLKVLGCGVFSPYVEALAQEAPHEVAVKLLDAGLHSRPNDLRLLLQEAIDEASSSGQYDAIVAFYGLCGRGVAGLVAREIPVIIPRAHDCITLFLGSREKYLKQFHKNPGTFYHTLGWLKEEINPQNREATELYSNYAKAGYGQHPEYRDLAEKYGEENAEHILAFMDRWKQHYSRAAYINLGFEGEEEAAEFTREMAEVFEWTYEQLEGDAELLRLLLAGDWEEEARIFVLPPHHRARSTGDDRLFEAVPLDSSDLAEALSAEEVTVFEAAGEQLAPEGLGLGIDAGGTYTDAVLYDLGAQQVLAKAKSLTTYHDLVIGIRGALEGLPAELLARVEVTSLSTTLATNAIVEGRGHKVGLIVLSPWESFIKDIGHKPVKWVPGHVTITGEVNEPLDEVAARKAIQTLLEHDHCAALVIAAYGAVRNPVQVARVRELIREVSDVPVICAHELSRRLNAIRGAQTAVANARLMPVIQHLIESVHQALQDFNVPGKLMVVKGDGTPVDESVARARPIETILSGPAASVSGAKLLTGLDEALVIDIGGTTTDCAILQEGHVAVSPEGARVGEYTMSVDVVEICTVGLGGDSRLDFDRERRLTVGPRRNLPVCYLAATSERARKFYENFDPRRWSGASSAAVLDVLVPGAKARYNPSPTEKRLLKLLDSGPIPALEASWELGLDSYQLLPLKRLEELGIVKRAALTPTDLLHVTGEFTRWDAEAARLMLAAFATLLGKSAEETLALAREAITRRLFEELVRREVSFEQRALQDLPEDWAFLLERAFHDEGQGLGVGLSLRRPVIALGAPAGALMPPVLEHLAAELIVPEHADVANAIGAIGSEVVVREEVLIKPGEASNYVLYGTEERLEFSELASATDAAVSLSRARAREKALQAGALAPQVTVSRRDKVGTLADGGNLWLERSVTAVASGGAFGGRKTA